MSTLGDMAKNDAYYHPEKHRLIGVNIDSSAFVRADGSLDVDKFVDECMACSRRRIKMLYES